MSIRPYISGFNLNKLKSLFNSKDEMLIRKLKEHYFNSWERLEPQEINYEDYKFIDEIVNGEIIENSLDIEDCEQTEIIISLAFYDQKHLRTDSYDWKEYFVVYAEDMITDFTPKPDDKQQWLEVSEHLSFLLGRPFFGKRCDELPEIYYGYLTQQGVQSLLAGFEKFPHLLEDVEEFGEELQSWLYEINEANRDLWFYCQ